MCVSQSIQPRATGSFTNSMLPYACVYTLQTRVVYVARSRTAFVIRVFAFGVLSSEFSDLSSHARQQIISFSHLSSHAVPGLHNPPSTRHSALRSGSLTHGHGTPNKQTRTQSPDHHTRAIEICCASLHHTHTHLRPSPHELLHSCLAAACPPTVLVIVMVITLHQSLPQRAHPGLTPTSSGVA